MYRILELNPQLAPYSGDIDLRMFLYRTTKARILGEGQTLNDFANAHNFFGFHRVDGGGYTGSGPPVLISCTWKAISTTGTRPAIP